MRHFLSRFYRDESGSVLILAAVMMLIFVAVGGAAYDLGVQQLVKLHNQQALDAAVLSGAVTGANDGGVQEKNAEMFYTANFAESFMGYDRMSPDFQVEDGVNISGQATYEVDTLFTKTLGTEAQEYSDLSISPIKNVYSSIDLILVLDNSLSMNETDVGSDASLPGNLIKMKAMCNSIFGATNTNCTRTGSNSLASQSTKLSRLNALRYSAEQLATDFLNPNDFSHRVGIVNWSDQLVDKVHLSGDYSTIRDRIDSLFLDLGTESTFGLQGAKEMATGPGGFRDDAVHAIVLLTDGQNNNKSIDNPASLAICEEMKNDYRTVVFTVMFGVQDPSEEDEIRQFLSDCATGPNGPSEPNEDLYFFSAPNAEELQEVFESITTTVQKVRLMK